MTNSNKLQPIAVSQWTNSLRPVLDDMQGRPLNIHKLLANHPALLTAWWGLRQHIVSGGALGKRNAELVILRTAVHSGSWYEWASHVKRALSSDLSLQEIEHVLDGPSEQHWSDVDALLLTAVDELETRRALQSETVKALEQHFDHQQILDIAAIHGTYVMLGNILNTWELELDEQSKCDYLDNESRKLFASKAKLARDEST